MSGEGAFRSSTIRTARPESPCIQYEDGEKAYILVPLG